MPQRADEADPGRAGEHGCERHQGHHEDRQRDAGEGQRHHRRDEPAQHERPLPADDDEARARRQRDAERGEDERGGAQQRVLPREGGAEAALPDEPEKIGRRFAERQQEDREQPAGHGDREERDDDVFGAGAEPVQPFRGGGRAHGRRGGLRSVGHRARLGRWAIVIAPPIAGTGGPEGPPEILAQAAGASPGRPEALIR